MSIQRSLLRLTFFSWSLLLFITASSAQSSTKYIDSLSVSYQNLQNEDELMPPSNRDTSVQRVTIQANFSLYIPKPELINNIVFWIAKETKSESNKEVRRFTLACVKNSDGIYCLTFKNKIYPILNRKVLITQEINQQLLKKGCKLYVQAIPMKGESNAPLSVSLRF